MTSDEKLAKVISDLSVKIDSLTVERNTLRQCVTELERDAKRYRFIRDELAIELANWHDGHNDIYRWKLGPIEGKHNFDAAIDAAMETKQ